MDSEYMEQEAPETEAAEIGTCELCEEEAELPDGYWCAECEEAYGGSMSEAAERKHERSAMGLCNY